MKHIAEIVVEPHGVKRPHQTQKLLLIKELRKVKGDSWDDDFHDKENKEKQCTKLEIAEGWQRERHGNLLTGHSLNSPDRVAEDSGEREHILTAGRHV